MVSVTRKGGLVCGEKAFGSENPLIAQLPDAGYTLAQDSSMVCLGWLRYGIITSSAHSSWLHFLHVHSSLSRLLSKAICILMYALVIFPCTSLYLLLSAGDLSAASKSQNTKDNGVHAHVPGQAVVGTNENHIKSTSFFGLGREEQGVGLEGGDGLLLESNPAYHCGMFLPESNANNNSTHEPQASFPTRMRDSGFGGNGKTGAALTADQEVIVRAPTLNVGEPPLNARAPPPNVSTPPLNYVGAPPPNDEAGIRVSGTYENPTDLDEYDICIWRCGLLIDYFML